MGTIMVELVDYKCADCGKIEQFRGDQNGISCKSCGGRIFMKLRRPGTKRIVAE
jgi:DNA-directed RNA polymerase subunit RPC12/RpoP